MRIVSMVPSWTETLLMCNVQIVGRTRFCIHPDSLVKCIPAVGGTKDVRWELVKELKPDLLILDQEENPRSMSDESPVEVLATHVRSANDVARDLRKIADRLGSGGSSKKLRDLAERWDCIVQHKLSEPPPLEGFPGVVRWIRGPVSVSRSKYSSNAHSSNAHSSNEQIGNRFVYVIWQRPWMAASRGTFISSVLDILGVSPDRLWPGPEELGSEELGATYPAFEMASAPQNSVFFFSTEPYPFNAKLNELIKLPLQSIAIVDGESFSWFGVRSLEFLEAALSVG